MYVHLYSYVHVYMCIISIDTYIYIYIYIYDHILIFFLKAVDTVDTTALAGKFVHIITCICIYV